MLRWPCEARMEFAYAGTSNVQRQTAVTGVCGDVSLPRINPRLKRNTCIANHTANPYIDMTTVPDRSFALPQLGGKSAVIIFILTLVAFVVESQLAQVRTYFHS